MSSATRRAGAATPIKVEQQEEVFVIVTDNKSQAPISLAMVRPLKLEPVSNPQVDAKPSPSTSRAVLAEVKVESFDPAPPLKWDLYELAPRSCLSPPPPPADQVKRRSVPGGHASATPRLKYAPYQTRR